MAPGDLNLKKSWHPGLMKNQEKVWKLEQEALEERKKIQERQLEIAKEKELSELKALQYAKTGERPGDRMEWMYDQSGVGDGGKLITSEAEDYLLGKKRVDSLIVNNQKSEEKKMGFDKLESEVKLNERDEITKTREDPMQKIKAQQLKKMEELRLQKRLEEEKKNSSHRNERSHRSSSRHHTSHSHHRDDDRRRSRYDDERHRSDRHKDERHRSDRYRDDKYRDDRHRSERHRDYRREESRDGGSRSSRHRDDDYYRERDEKYKSQRESSRRKDDYREPRSYEDDFKNGYRDRDSYSTTHQKKPVENKAKISDLEREARLKEMLQDSQKMKNNRHERIGQEHGQLSREEELRNKLLASKTSKVSNDSPNFLQRSKRIIED